MPQNAVQRTSEKPLQGAVLCCTSIPPEVRSRLTDYAEQMGAEHRLDLTSDVTHLLVGETGTPKYQYVAREREDVKVLQPQWVEAVRQRWMEDKPLDLNELDAEFKVPVLAGLKICITGFDDLTFRAQLQENIKRNGGLYTGDLTKDVTHLIAATAEGKKFEYASLWQKRVVGLRWYKDTLERGMQLDESLYHPSKPADEQGRGAWNRQTSRATTLGKRQNVDAASQEPSRKLRRTASAKFGSQNETLWNDIVGAPELASYDDEHDTLRPTKSMPDIRSINSERRGEFQSRRSVNVDQAAAPPSVSGIFKNFSFALQGFDVKRSALLKDAIVGHGGLLYENVADLLATKLEAQTNLYVIVPHHKQTEHSLKLPNLEHGLKLANELWLEWCISSKRAVPVEKYPLGQVFRANQSAHVSKLLVNATGFSGIQTMHISKMMTAMGARYGEVFTPDHSVLVSSDARICNAQKFGHAIQWKIPVVSERWLVQLLASDTRPPFEPFLIPQYPKSKSSTSKRPAGEGNSERKSKKTLTPEPSFHTQDTLPVTSKTETDFTPGSPSQRNERASSLPAKESASVSVPLKEVSPNLSPRKETSAVAEGKKKLFQTYDGYKNSPEILESNSRRNSVTSDGGITPAPTISALVQDPIAEFLQIKAQAAARAAENSRPSRQLGPRGLSGRALSNLSNGSRNSKVARDSRASSIDSMNTDGLGTELGNNAALFSTNEPQADSTVKTSLMGRMNSSKRSSFGQQAALPVQAIDLNDPNLLRDEYAEVDHSPQRTQLGYEDSEEAIAMRRKLAEKRRARGRDAHTEVDSKSATSPKKREQPKEKRVIRDDEAILGRTRRTRQKDRVMEMFETNDDFAL